MTYENQQFALTDKPLTWRTITVAGFFVAAIGAAAVIVLLRFVGAGSPADQARLEIIKTAGTIVVGTGGAVALLLTARRQRYTELGLVSTDRDATERRITELYTKAADQLGSDKAPVRLAGLYALERLAQGNPTQRQTIVNVLCAYLQMFTAPGDPPPENAEQAHQERYERRTQELRVRAAAQRILCRHLRRSEETYWEGLSIDLTQADLTGANLADANLTGADLTQADLAHANLTGAYLTGASLGYANLTDANLTDANLTGASLVYANLTGAYLTGADLTGAYLARADLTGAYLARADLEGLHWNSATKWPAEVTDQIREASDEIAPGFYRLSKLLLPDS